MSDRPAKRAPFSPELKELREFARGLVPRLEQHPSWYGSVWFERKSGRIATANLKQTHVADTFSSGMVLRIYNGQTLFEQATDDLGQESLLEAVDRLVERVRAAPVASDRPVRPFRPSSWIERIRLAGEREILSQIPPRPRAETPVHFGVPFVRDPHGVSTQDVLSRLKGLVARCLELAPSHGLAPPDLSYVVARESFTDEESFFIDREVNLSQRLYRLALTLITMSGADRTFERIGGLGGVEAVEVSDRELAALLDDLSALRKAERLVPGRHRVITGPVVSGVLAHEAFGHSQEADTCARGRSKAWDLHKAGIRVGNEHATILNNPAVFANADQPCAAWGSHYFDEEGWFASSHVLLDRGMLGTPMTNLTSAIRLGVPRTANGKRESWANGVYARQTNTYFSPGTATLETLMKKLGDGFVAIHPAGGMEDPKGMGIQVGISYLKEVKDGRLTGRIFRGPAGGDIQMTGYVPDVLERIVDKSKIEAHTEEADRSAHPLNDAGGCGKYHKEFVHAGCGGPYMLLDGVMLG